MGKGQSSVGDGGCVGCVSATPLLVREYRAGAESSGRAGVYGFAHVLDELQAAEERCSGE